MTSVKVDRSFVAGLSANGDSGLVGSILALAEALGLTTVAEGVETVGQLEGLTALECHLAQGYYLGYPQASDEISELLERSAADPAWHGEELRPGAVGSGS